jgi:hypothetical protein
MLVWQSGDGASATRHIGLPLDMSTTERRLQPPFQTLFGCIWADLRDEVGTSLNNARPIT